MSIRPIAFVNAVIGLCVGSLVGLPFGPVGLVAFGTFGAIGGFVFAA